MTERKSPSWGFSFFVPKPPTKQYEIISSIPFTFLRGSACGRMALPMRKNELPCGRLLRFSLPAGRQVREPERRIYF